MDSDLISRTAALEILSQEWVEKTPYRLFVNGELIRTKESKWIEKLMKSIEDIPTVDAVEVVRCKDCESCEKDEVEPNHYVFHCYKHRRYVNPNGFCSDGAKMNGVKNDT